MRFILILQFLMFLSAFPLDDSVLEKRIKVIQTLVSEEPVLSEQMFHPDFLKAVPLAQLKATGHYYFKNYGKVIRYRKLKSDTPYYGEYEFITDKNMQFITKAGLEDKPPHRVHTLWFSLPQPRLASCEEALEKLNELDGELSLLFCKLEGDKPTPLYELNPDKALAIGSAFKLYILGALMEGIKEKTFTWNTVIPLKNDHKSWPSGILQTWPVGSPMTLHTFAAQMISISDNTATDHLLYYLGRQKVEAVCDKMGNLNLKKNLPFLSTSEMFLIKEKGFSKERVSKWLKMKIDAKRAYLQELRKDRDNYNGLDLTTPTAISTVEWFASAWDCVRAMNWLKNHGEENPKALKILAINPGLTFDKKTWTYVGYKGGSEPGVLNMTWLLKHKNGRWYGLSAGINNETKSIDESKFIGLIQSFMDQVSKKEEP